MFTARTTAAAISESSMKGQDQAGIAEKTAKTARMARTLSGMLDMGVRD